MLLVLVKLLTGHREVVQLLNTTPSVVRSHLLILSLKSILGYKTMCCLIKTGKSSSIFPPLFHCLIQCAIISSIVPLSHPLSIHCLVISSTVLPLFHYHIYCPSIVSLPSSTVLPSFHYLIHCSLQFS